MHMLPANVQPLPWDSDFLGYPVARLTTDNLTLREVKDAIDVAKQAGIKLLYSIADPTSTDLNAVLRQQGAWLADRKTTFAMSARTIDVKTSISNIRPAIAHTPQLESLAWQSGEYSRFRLDPHFDTMLFRQLYSHWLRNSLNGNIAKQVLAWYNDEGQELGLLTLGEKNRRADIGLLAVEATARGQRIGQQLVTTAQEWAVGQGYTELQVVTQGSNRPACAFYEKCGFIVLHIENIYHLWLS